MSHVRDIIMQKLNLAFDPVTLNVIDDSASHAGHTGNPGGGEGTHFTVEIASLTFAGKSRIEAHRMVNAVLSDELAGPVHALAIKVIPAS